MRNLLTRRHRYASGDIPHRDLLDCLDEKGNLSPLLDALPDDGHDDRAHDSTSAARALPASGPSLSARSQMNSAPLTGGRGAMTR